MSEEKPVKKEDKKEDKKENKVDFSLLKKLEAENKSLKENLSKLEKNASELKNKFKTMFSEEKPKESEEISNLKNWMQDNFKKVHERLDRRDHEDAISSFSSQLGLKTQEQRDFLEFKIGKAQSEKGSELNDEELEKIGNSVKEAFGGKIKKTIEKGSTSTVNEDNSQQSAEDLGDSSAITFKKYKEMNLIQKNDFYEANPKMGEKFARMENDEKLSIARSF